ncbi:MAG: type II toxin-antitoxin system VapC family toxin [Dehalococcoidia bacterium]
MLLLDVNVLFYAHREEFPQHTQAREWVEELISSGRSFAATHGTLSAVVRLATNVRWIQHPSPFDEVFGFCAQIRAAGGWVDLNPGPRHWEIFERLCRRADARGDLVPDAFLAALAIENDCELISFDRGLRRFPGLRLSLPGQ